MAFVETIERGRYEGKSSKIKHSGAVVMEFEIDFIGDEKVSGTLVKRTLMTPFGGLGTKTLSGRDYIGFTMPSICGR